jgi:hypothetical protein
MVNCPVARWQYSKLKRVPCISQSVHCASFESWKSRGPSFGVLPGLAIQYVALRGGAVAARKAYSRSALVGCLRFVVRRTVCTAGYSTLRQGSRRWFISSSIPQDPCTCEQEIRCERAAMAVRGWLTCRQPLRFAAPVESDMARSRSRRQSRAHSEIRTDRARLPGRPLTQLAASLDIGEQVVQGCGARPVTSDEPFERLTRRASEADDRSVRSANATAATNLSCCRNAAALALRNVESTD